MFDCILLRNFEMQLLELQSSSI